MVSHREFNDLRTLCDDIAVISPHHQTISKTSVDVNPSLMLNVFSSNMGRKMEFSVKENQLQYQSHN